MSDAIADAGAAGAGEESAALVEPAAMPQGRQSDEVNGNQLRRRPRRRASFGVCLQPATRATSLAGFNTTTRDDGGELGRITAAHQTSMGVDHARALSPQHGLGHNPVSREANAFWLGVRMPSQGADRRRSAPDPFKRSILHMAAESGDTTLCGVLLGAGTAVDARDKRLLTPLHLAALHGRCAIVRLLLSWGANPSMVDEHGRTPLHLAAGGASDAHASVIAWLLLGCDQNAGGVRVAADASNRPGSRRGGGDGSCCGSGFSHASTQARSGSGTGGADPRVPDRRGRSALDVATSVAAVTCSEATTIAVALAAAVARCAATSAAMAVSNVAMMQDATSPETARMQKVSLSSSSSSPPSSPEHGLEEVLGPERLFSLRSLVARVSAAISSAAAARRAVALLRSASAVWELWSPLWLGVGQYQARGGLAALKVEVDVTTAIHGEENARLDTLVNANTRERVDGIVQHACSIDRCPFGNVGTARNPSRHMRVRELQDRAQLEVRRLARWSPLRTLCRAGSCHGELAAAFGLAPELLEYIVHFLPDVQS